MNRDTRSNAPDSSSPPLDSPPSEDTPSTEAPSPETARPDDAAAGGVAFPVVGVGASAGGLRAFQAFFEALPVQPGMAFIVVQHLSPDHESELAELLQAKTDLEVAQVEDHPEIQPNRVYVIPPGKNLEVAGRRLRLSDPQRARGHRSPVDLFFRSLAEHLGERAVCIVLSGTGSDGTLGLRAVKERGGLTMAQDPADAEYDGMPRSAIGTGFVDLTGTAAELAAKLVEVRRAADLADLPGDEEALPTTDAEALHRLLTRLQEQTGHDFRDYKRSTILRRIGRRMQIVGAEGLPAYLRLARDNPEELHDLMRDFLISVTNFFRDRDAFEKLEADVVPALFEGKRAGDQVRVWVAGCATGEEAYSIALLLKEHAATLDSAPDLQVFATDIDEEALEFAREGLYPDAIAADVSPARLGRFFEENADGYRVRPDLRETVLFASHNLIHDPPFSRLDLVSCRNLLIYLQRDVQARVFSAFHYALRPGGYLFLGSSEALDSLSKTFRDVGKRERLFQRRDGVAATSTFPVRNVDVPRPADRSDTGDGPIDERSLMERYRDWTLRRYAPSRLLVNEDYDITHVFGEAGRFLRDREGPATQRVTEKVQRALRLDLRGALFRAFEAHAVTETLFQRIEVAGEDRIVRMRVGPVEEDGFPERLVEVAFLELDPASTRLLGSSVPDAHGADEDPRVPRLEEELRVTRAHLQAMIEERETSNEEFKASNEELRSMNEELQSTTEELETSEEELQSMNEELRTVNQELKNKIEELGRANSDLQNLIASTDIGTLFLDRHLHLKRFTPRADELFNVIPSDVGRPFAHLSHRLDRQTLPSGLPLPALAQRVLEQLEHVEEEVQDRDGRWFLLRMLPYRTEDGLIDGVVVTFVDVDATKRAEQQAARQARQQAAVAELGRAALGGGALDKLMRQAVEAAAAAAEAPLCEVLELGTDRESLLLREGVGWDDGLVGSARVPRGGGSQAGYTLLTDGPVLVANVAEEARFSAPALLTEHAVASGISVTIPGPGASPFGVLGVYHRTPGHFQPEDIGFVQSVANVLSAALQRDHDEAVIASQLSEIEAVYDTAPVGLAFIDRDYRFVRINHLLAEIDGKPIEEHLGRSVREVLPTLADQLEALYDRVLDGGESVLNVEIRGSTPRYPGEECIFLASYVPQRVESRIVGINVVVRDVTELIRTRERLAESEQRLQLALEGGRLGSLTLDPETETLSFDARAAEIAGLPETVSLEAGFENVHPDERALVADVIARALDPGDEQDAYDFEHRLNRDATRWVISRGRCFFETDEEGQRHPVRLAGVVLDVTARKHAEEAAERRRTEISSIYESTPVGLCLLDRERRFVRINQRLAEIQGRSVEEHLGHVAYDLFGDIAEEVRPNLEGVYATGKAQTNVLYLLPVPSSPDERRDWLVSYHPILDEEGAVAYVSVTVQEVTALKETQRRLEALTAELEDRVRERTKQVRTLANDLTEAEQQERRRIAQVLHDDFQQYLYALQMKLEQIGSAGSQAQAQPFVERGIEILDEAIQAARTLTVDLSPPVLAGEGLDRSLEWLIARMREAYGLDTALHVRSYAELDMSVHVLLFQFVRELLFNVVKHAGVDGADVTVEADGEMLRVEVADHGRGFDEAALQHDRDEERAGFGLFSVRERLHLIGGTLQIVSDAGNGTRVILRAPLRV